MNRARILLVACLIAPFVICCVIDPNLRDPGWVLLTGLPALGGVYLSVAAWHCSRIAERVDDAVSRAAASHLAGSEVERVLQDAAPAGRAGHAARRGLGDQPGRPAALTGDRLVDGQQHRLRLVR